jgi:predicted small metal-binding protein
MATKIEKKEFALSQLAPYLKDPNTCGYNKESSNCEYLAPNGNMCVAGKNMIEPKFGVYKGIDDVLEDNEFEQEGLFKPEVVGILTNKEWNHMQNIHDSIAIHTNNIDRLKERIQRLNLFTYEELVERAESLE